MKVANEINSCREDVIKYLKRYYAAESRLCLCKTVIHGDFGNNKVDRRRIKSISYTIDISYATSFFPIIKKRVYITKQLFEKIKHELPVIKSNLFLSFSFLNFTTYESSNYSIDEFTSKMITRREIIDNFLKGDYG